MVRRAPLLRVALSSAVLLVVLAGAGMCQGLGIDSYSFVHPFGIMTATTSRLFGMGGQVSATWDTGFASPAFAALQETQSGGLRMSSTSFEAGPELIGSQVHWVLPLCPNRRGLQFNLFSLETRDGLAPMGEGPVALDLRQTVASVDYGWRVSSHLSAGLSVSAISRNKFDVAVPGGGPTLLRVDAEPTWGGRLGLVYGYGGQEKPSERNYIGVAYDLYQEDADAQGLFVGGTASRAFHNSFLAVGASHHVTDNLLLAAEWQRGVTHDGELTETLTGWHFGGEYLLPKGVALRLGAQDERTTFGFGVNRGDWTFDYAYMNRWNDDIADELLGGSETHQFEVIFTW